MSNITVPTGVGTAIGTLPDSKPTNPLPKPASVNTPPPAPSANPTDNISLSVNAVATGATGATPPLSDSAATAQSVTLRQQLGNTPLSGTARQNQAIVALLR